MDANNPYFKQVQLLVRTLPYVAKERIFALKGGTAINLFVRDLPRLSVDIDLSYLPLDDRETALKNIAKAFSRIKSSMESAIPDVRVQHNSNEHRMIVSSVKDRVQVVVELSPVLRGSVFPAEELALAQSAQKLFGSAKIQVLSLPDLYAGKICAALDRQHPRDFFDIKLLMENEGISRDLIRAFLVYLISHDRPISEVIAPPVLKDLREKYDREFKGMTETPVSLETLQGVREKLIKTIHSSLVDTDKEFLLSFKAKAPKWDLLGLKGIDQLPAVKWKMLNLEKMKRDKHMESLAQLEKALSGKARDMKNLENDPQLFYFYQNEEACVKILTAHLNSPGYKKTYNPNTNLAEIQNLGNLAMVGFLQEVKTEPQVTYILTERGVEFIEVWQKRA